MTARIPLYVFRALQFAPEGDTVVTAAPRDAVVTVYGGGGAFQTAGLAEAFNGCAVYRDGDPEKGDYHFAIWGERKASKFRQSFRDAGIEVEIIKSPPPGRLILKSTR